MASASYTLARGKELVALHLTGWTFDLDHARTRVGCCHYADKRITISRHLIAYLAEDEVDQTILHEVAHALVGHEVGHSKPWQRMARSLGYTGGRTIEVPEARMGARWRGVCKEGHEVFRHRKPSRRVYCGTCAQKHRRNVITWEDRGLGLLGSG
ncbi:MAG: SprT-like domain-containing protein [Propionibacteriaceae bacterium]|nr:SprT-like domain-containing protein [Propionibacteriaceae bacterium]